MTDQSGLRGGLPDSRPIPDPTVLTTEQLHREIASAVRLLEAKLTAIDDVTQVRFAKMDREFEMVESRRQEQKVDVKAAVDAALAAAKEAVKEQTLASEKAITKSETSAAEQSKQQYATFSASLKGVTDTLADVKDRVGTIEAMRLGAVTQHDAFRLDLGTAIAIGTLLVAIVVIFLKH